MSNPTMQRLIGRKAKLLPDSIGDIIHLSTDNLRERGLTVKQAISIQEWKAGNRW